MIISIITPPGGAEERRALGVPALPRDAGGAPEQPILLI